MTMKAGLPEVTWQDYDKQKAQQQTSHLNEQLAEMNIQITHVETWEHGMNQIQTTWGKLPNDVLKELNQRYWQIDGILKQLLNHEISQENAIEITLKAPSSGKVAAQNTLHFQAFVKRGRFSKLSIQMAISN